MQRVIETWLGPNRKHVHTLHAVLVAAIAAWTIAATARADIVWEGQTVAAWPDLEQPELRDEHGHLLMLQQQSPARRGFYPSPKGSVYGLTILVDFSDQPPAFNKAQIAAFLNQKGYNLGGVNGSVRDYYLDMSNGQVDLQNDVIGVYRMSKPRSYYDEATGYERAGELVREVLNAIDAEVDFSKYDNDKDGRVDAISIVYAGERGARYAKGLWPHASGTSLRKDGVTLSRYMIASMSTRLSLYMFIHELGHMMFGWPDLYGFGDYCAMGNSSNSVNPAGINDFFRADQGWIPRVDIAAGTRASYTATPGGGGYQYANPADSGELFFWSNVQNSGRWHALRGGGLLFFRFNRKLRANNPPTSLALAVVQADGLEQLAVTRWPRPGSDAKDFFVGGGTAEFSDTTKPSAKWANGTASGLRVYDIGPNSQAIRFSVGGAGTRAVARMAPDENADDTTGALALPNEGDEVVSDEGDEADQAD